jgi:hypothetical protein
VGRAGGSGRAPPPPLKTTFLPRAFLYAFIVSGCDDRSTNVDMLAGTTWIFKGNNTIKTLDFIPKTDFTVNTTDVYNQNFKGFFVLKKGANDVQEM